MPRLLERDEVISRSKIFFTLCISFLLALLPFTVGNDENKQKAFVLNDAYANPVAFVGAYDFLQAAAAAAGLSAGDFVATGIGVTAMGTGMNVANDLGAQMGRSASYNLDCLLDAADYPAWDDLTAEEQSEWGNKTNYDSDKYNSLCNAFGLGDDYEAYKQGYTGSGGSNFEFSTAAQNKLNRLGRIGNNWANGVGNTIDYVKSAIADEEYIRSYLGADSTYADVDTSDYDEYSTSWPASVNVNKGNNVAIRYKSGYIYAKMSNDVYFVIFQRNDNSITLLMFSANSFSRGIAAGSQPTKLYTAGSYTKNGKTVYRADYSEGSGNAPFSSDAAFTYADSPRNYDDINNFSWSMIYGGPEISIGQVPQVPDYPEETTGDEEVYFPAQGVTNNTSWNIFITNTGSSGSVDLSEIVALLNRFNFTSSGDLRVHDSEILTAIENCCNRFQFYATGQLKVHDEGIFDQLTDVQTTLNQILAKIGLSADAPDIIGEFDYPELQAKSNTLVEDISTLAPFGSMLVISETVGILSQTEQITEPKLDVPFRFGLNQDYSVEIDLSWLDPLKPLINALLIMVLVMTLAGVTLRFVELEASA